MSKETAVQKAQEAMVKSGGVVSIQTLIQQSIAQLKHALPKHMDAERMARIALTTIRLNPELANCTPESFLGALFQSSQLGLEPNTNGEAWLIPYRNKQKDGSYKKVVQFQVGAYGLVKLYWNHQNAVGLQVETVYKNDTFEYDLGSMKPPIHKQPPFGEDRGEVMGYYACATLTNGGVQLKVLSKRAAFEFAKKHSKCWDKEKQEFYYGTPWRDHFDAMAQKTVLKQLMKLLPKSVEIQHALAMDETVKTKVEADMTEIPDETIWDTPVEVIEDKNQITEGIKRDDKTQEELDAIEAEKRCHELLSQIGKAKDIPSLERIKIAVDEAVTKGDIYEVHNRELTKIYQSRLKALTPQH